MAEEREYLELAFHGRGGQGVKTAGDLLVYSLSHVGYRVNGQPLYGGERMGAPVGYFIRCTRSGTPISDRSLVRRPDAMAIFDPAMLVTNPALLPGLGADGILVLNTPKAAREFPRLRSRIATLPASQIAKDCGLIRGSVPIVGPVMVGAFARVTGLASLPTLEQCLGKAIGELDRDRMESNVTALRRGWEAAGPLAWRGGERT